jgi:signal transduction histidine kinase
LENGNSKEVLNPIVTELERKLIAKEKAISVLTERIDELSLASSPSLPVIEQNAYLEEVLASRTAELERQRAELSSALSELKAAQTQLVHSQKLEAIGSLAAGIAHEINTPAQFASDNTSFLRKSFSKILALLEAYQVLLDDIEQGCATTERVIEERERMKRAKLKFLLSEIPNALDGASEGLKRIGSIVRAMKEFSHPSNGLKQPNDLRDIVNTTATVARNEWKYVAELEMEFDETVPPVPCLRDELGQVLVNLIVNAAHAISIATENGAKGKGLIRISTRALPEYAEIVVSDNGCGIPESIHHRIFEPFFTTKPVGSGTGQGLAITYSVIVDKHHGKISFQSKVDEGTSFTILLPLRDIDQSLPPSIVKGGP